MEALENVDALEENGEVENINGNVEASTASDSALNGGEQKVSEEVALVRPSRKDFETDDAYEDAKEEYQAKKLLAPVLKMHEEERERMMRTIKATRLEKRELKVRVDDLSNAIEQSRLPDPKKLIEPDRKSVV